MFATQQERDEIIKAGRHHEAYDRAIRDLWMDVRNLVKHSDEGLYDWLYEGSYDDMTTIDAQAIADEWDANTEDAK